jgi:hypothetical protein
MKFCVKKVAKSPVPLPHTTDADSAGFLALAHLIPNHKNLALLSWRRINNT